jgi:rod shape-determining protein MreD
MHLDYHLVVIALIGLYRGTVLGVIAGWGIGFLVGAPDPGMMGWNSLFGSALGWVVGYCGERLFLEYTFSRWLILWLVILAYRLIYLVAATAGDWERWRDAFWTGALASAGISATVGVAVSLLWDRTHPPHRHPPRPAATEADEE